MQWVLRLIFGEKHKMQQTKKLKINLTILFILLK